MKLLGNIIWIIFGGLMISIEYVVAGIILCVTIIGIPFGFQCFKLAVLALAPYGQEVVTKPDKSGCLMAIMNIIWIFTGGLIIALSHLFWGVILCITIIGIPFGMQHFKLLRLSFLPFGKGVL